VNVNAFPDDLLSFKGE